VLKVDEKQCELDMLHDEQVKRGDNKYSTLKKVSSKKINCTSRSGLIQIFEIIKIDQLDIIIVLILYIILIFYFSKYFSTTLHLYWYIILYCITLYCNSEFMDINSKILSHIN